MVDDELMLNIFEDRKTKNTNRWSKDEDDILISNWVNTIDYSHLGRTIESCNDRAKRLGLVKTEYITSLLADRKQKYKDEFVKNTIARNKKRGRDLSPENLKCIAMGYKSIQEFRYKDKSAYVTASKLGIINDTTSHCIDEYINIPQMMLFEIIKIIFPNESIRYNDRTAIHPYEIDIYCTESKVGFEYDSVTFHSDKDVIDRDLFKDSECISKGIKLYRIKEVCKRNPYPHIINQLNQCGFYCDHINMIDIEYKIFNKTYDNQYIKDLCESYISYDKFVKDNQKIVKMLKSSDLLHEYTKHMKKSSRYMNDDDMISILKTMVYKKELLDFEGGLYLKVYKSKNLEIKELFANLKRYTCY